MRLLGFLPFLLIGVLVGVFATKLFNRSPITAVPNCALGVFAALFGLFFRDVLNFESGVFSGLLAALTASIVIVFAVNAIGPLVFSLGDKNPEP